MMPLLRCPMYVLFTLMPLCSLHAQGIPVLTNPSGCGLGLSIVDNNCPENGVFYQPNLFNIIVSNAPGTTLGVDVYLKEVRLIIRHGWAADIGVILVSPGGVVATVVQNRGGAGDNFGDPNAPNCQTYATFAVGACTPLDSAAAPFTAVPYPSEQNFYIFNDNVTNPNGTWQLRICDDLATDAGSLEFVELVFEPIACLPISQATFLNADTTSVLLGWTPAAFCGTTIIEYGPPGFTPGNDAQAGVGGEIAFGNCPPFLLQGLQPERNYDIYIRRFCNTGGYSINSCPVTVATGCQPPPITLVETFNSQLLCNTMSCNSVCNTTGLWRNVSSDAFDWLVTTGPTPTAGTGPLDDVSGGGRYVYIETTGNQCAIGAVARLLSPCVRIDKQGFPDCHLSFHYHMFGSNIGTLRLETSTDGGFTWSVFWQLSGNQSNAWKKIYLSLAAFPDGAVVQFRFAGVKGNGVRGDIALDQIVFYGSENLGFPQNQFYADSDGDGFGRAGTFVLSCAATAPAGYADNDDDCNDTNASIYPGAPEVGCDGIDNNCNGLADDAILPPPPAESDTICSGEQAVICATALPGYFMFWYDSPSGNDVVHFGSCYEPVLPPNNGAEPVVYLYYASQTNFSCFSEPRTEVRIVVNPTPTGAFSETPSVCPGEVFDLASLNIVDENFTGGTITFHTQSPATPANELLSTMVSPPTTTDYYYLITNPYGCTDEGLVTLTVLSGPNLSFLPADSISLCRESTTTIGVQVNGGIGNYTYFWNTGANTASIPISASGNPGTTALYQVTVTDAEGCFSTGDIAVTTTNSIDSIRVTITNVTTCMGNNGSINIEPLNGLSPFNYQWTGSNGTSGNGVSPGNVINIANLAQGSYRVTITDASDEGCRFILRNVLVQGPSAIVEDVVVEDVSCAAASDGSICLDVDGDNPQYLWSNDATTPCIQNLAGGTYSVTISDGMCATVVDNIVVNEPDSLRIKPDLTFPLCHNAANGAIFLTVFGGTPDYSFLWSNMAVTQNISGLTGGDYSVTLTDGNGCILAETIPLPAPLPLQIVLDSMQNVSCNGGTDGYLKVSATGGTSPYRFNWNDNSTAPVRSNLPTGTYMVTVTDFKGCQAVRILFITQPQPLTVNLIAATDPVCLGDESGALTVAATGGTAPYSYFWDHNATGPAVTGLGVGEYRVVVVDAKGCQSDTVVLELLPVSTISLNVTQVSPACVGRTDGSISLQVLGTPPFQYTWNNNSHAANLNNIGIGTYTVSITDGQGCEYDTAVTLTAPQVFGIEISALSPSCFGSLDGLVDIIMLQSGTPPITYLWSHGPITQDVSGLAPGDYQVTVSDGQGCKFISDTIPMVWPSPLTYRIEAIGEIECHGEADGFIEWGISGGTPPYSYTWFGLFTNSEDVYDLPAGSYRVLVQDQRGCTIDTVFSLAQPPALALQTSATLGGICDPDAMDALSANASGGTPIYTYLWSNGAMTPTLPNAAPGDYLLTVTDAKGCEIRSTTVKVPERVPPVRIDAFAATTVSCYNGNDASMTATISGGSGLYLYHFTPTYIEVTGATSVTVGQLLHSPEYSVTITDLNTGCVVSSASQSPGQPDPLAIERDNIEVVNCFGGNDGGIYITTSGGIGPYTYQWFNEAGELISESEDLLFIASGVYTATATDANGCQVSLGTTVTSSGNTVINLVDSLTILQHVRCRGDATGAIDITLSGGIPPFVYSWSNGASTEDLINIPAGIYEVTVTDADTCRSIIPGIMVKQPAQQLAPNAQLQLPACHDTEDGAIVTAANGGVPPYQYTWQENGITLPGETGSVLDDIGAGNYRLILQDTGGCIRFFNFVLDAPDPLQVDIQPALFDQPVTATAIATGGTPDYDYLWNTNDMTNQIEVLLSGFYEVTVTDDSQCVATASMLINDAAEVAQLRQAWVFPNPTTSLLQVEFELDRVAEVSWALYDAYGRMIWQERAGAIRQESRSLDFSDYPSGAYLLQLWADGNMLLRERVVKIE